MASIVDGCLTSGAEFRRFKHKRHGRSRHRLQQVPGDAARLVIADAVFSMDGDVIDLPKVVDLCRRYGAYLMIDEAHSVGVLGASVAAALKNITVYGCHRHQIWAPSARPIPSVGGYVAGKQELIDYLRHVSRGLHLLGSAAARAGRCRQRSLQGHPG